MKFIYGWELTEAVLDLVRSDMERGNKVTTTITKLNRMFKENNDLLKRRGDKSIWPNDHEFLKRRSRCFEFLKSGCFKPEKSEWSCRLSEIQGIISYKSGHKIRVWDTEWEISERDYHDLKMLLN